MEWGPSERERERERLEGSVGFSPLASFSCLLAPLLSRLVFSSGCDCEAEE
jgi:hypothetical protein